MNKNISEINCQEVAQAFFAQFDPKNQYDTCVLFSRMTSDLATFCQNNPSCCEGCNCETNLENKPADKPNQALTFTMATDSDCCGSSSSACTDQPSTCGDSSSSCCDSSSDACSETSSCSDQECCGGDAYALDGHDAEVNNMVESFFAAYRNEPLFKQCPLGEKMKQELRKMCSDFESYFPKLQTRLENKATFDFTSRIDRSLPTDLKTNRAIVKSMLNLNYYDDSISMWVADMDFKTAPAIQDAIKQRADQGILGYSLADKEYFQSIMDWYKRRHGMTIEKDWIVYSSGTLSALRNTLYSLTEKGDGVIIQPPVYFPFESNVNATGRTVLRNELIRQEDGSYAIDFEDFEAKAKDPNTTMFILCNPHNPIGQIWSKKEVQRLVSIAHENNVIVFSDEVHADLIRKGNTFTSVLNLDDSDLTIVATALNKTFNLAGMHLTNLVIKNPELKQRFQAYTGWVGISPLAIEATKAAYNDSEEWVEELNEVIDQNMIRVETFVHKHFPQARFTKPEGTYLTWIDLSSLGMDEQELLTKLADDAHIILEGGSMFGQQSKGFIRMNVALPEEVLKEALERMRKVIGTRS